MFDSNDNKLKLAADMPLTAHEIAMLSRTQTMRASKVKKAEWMRRAEEEFNSAKRRRKASEEQPERKQARLTKAAERSQTRRDNKKAWAKAEAALTTDVPIGFVP